MKCLFLSLKTKRVTNIPDVTLVSNEDERKNFEHDNPLQNNSHKLSITPKHVQNNKNT